jgi:bifunctional DNA-binding transcriptional regulator/antitoxin component of YhaV-PrlF toxin-antitoxin module
MEGTQVKVSRNGQVSVPAAVRHRWGTSTVLIIDCGDYAIVRPVPDDPIQSLLGAYAGPGPSVDAIRADDRAVEAASANRKQARAGWPFSVNAAEIRDQMVRVFGADPDGLEADLALLCHAGLTVQAVTHELGMQAGRIRARRYHRERASVSLADCVAALASNSPLATSDPALAEMVRAEGGKIHQLPDSQGRRP